jgi:hypothetical protein
MQRHELVRLAGEQALLKAELARLSTEQSKDISQLQTLGSDIGRDPNWLEAGTALLQRLDERHRTRTEGYRRLAELKRLTGID